MLFLRTSALPVLLVLLWWAASRHVPSLLLPSPAAVGEAFLSLLASGEWFVHAGQSLARVFAGYATASTLALGAAALLYRRPRLEGWLSPLMESLRVVPPLSLIPLLILWLGIDEAPKLAIVVLASFFPVFVTTREALARVARDYEDVSNVLALTPVERLRHVLLPGAAGPVSAGLRLGFGYAWRALVGAELIAASSGLGYLIEDAGSLAHTDVVFVGILSIALLGVGFDALFRRLAQRFEYGGEKR